jgi:hypothetical protein
MHFCSVDGCNNKLFGGGYCAYHQWLRKRKGGDLYAPKKRQKPINKESPKRKVANKRYLERLKEKWEEDLKKGDIRCFFCNEVMTRREDNHHILGRGSVILEEEWWSWAHNECHMAYTFEPIEKLRQRSWWQSFLSRLRIKSPHTYYVDLERVNKAELEFN